MRPIHEPGAFESRKFLVKVFPRQTRDAYSSILASTVAFAVLILTLQLGGSCLTRTTAYVFERNETSAPFSIKCVRTNVSDSKFFFCVFYEDILAANNRSRSFTLSGNSNTVVNAMVGGGTAGTPNACTNDWLLMGCVRVADRLTPSPTCEDRLCGGALNVEVSPLDRTVTSKFCGDSI